MNEMHRCRTSTKQIRRAGVSLAWMRGGRDGVTEKLPRWERPGLLARNESPHVYQASCPRLPTGFQESAVPLASLERSKGC